MINPINRRDLFAIAGFLRARTYRGRRIDPIPYPVREELTVNERLITSGERCRGPAGFMTRSRCVRVAYTRTCESRWDRNATRWTARAGPCFHHLRLIGFIDERRPKPMRYALCSEMRVIAMQERINFRHSQPVSRDWITPRNRLWASRSEARTRF